MNVRIVFGWVLAATAVFAWGCTEAPQGPAAAPSPTLNGGAAAGNGGSFDAAARGMVRADETVEHSSVDASLEWLRKYALKTEQVEQLLRENHTVTAENASLRQAVARLEADLAQAQRELADANEAMIQQRREVTDWQRSMAEFRSQMEQSQAAQMRALADIYKLLGGTVRPERRQPAGAEPAGEPAQELSHGRP